MPYENIPYKSYCWSLGTTSYRTKNFNQNIERQLVLLSDFWAREDIKGRKWKKDNETQAKYYDFMAEEGFLTGAAKNKPKDAREKTSGLVDIGLIDENRKLTPVGEKLMAISQKGDFSPDNALWLPKDSFIYLKQLLKTGSKIKGSDVRPFIVFLYLLNKVEYLSMDEYTYLLPLCVNRQITENMVDYIKTRHIEGKKDQSDIDEKILEVLMSMDNYQKGLKLLLENEVSSQKEKQKESEELIRTIGFNGKSRSYDKAYYPLYIALHKLYREKDWSQAERVYECTKKLQSKVGGGWRKMLFSSKSVKAIAKEPRKYLNKTEFDQAEDERSFKITFYRYFHLFKAKSNLSDYLDLNRRYIKNTDTVLFEDGIVKLDIVPRQFFDSCIEKLYEDAYTKCDFLPEDCSLEEIHPCLLIDEAAIIRGISRELRVSVSTMEEARNVLEDERYKRLQHLIDTQFTDERLIRLLTLFEKREDGEISRMVTDNADIPTIFEYILGIIWYKVSQRKGKILDYMKLSLEADLLPKTHAAGGEADIVYEYEETEIYPRHTLLLEATLANWTAQRIMEMEPVSRHLGQHLLKTGNHSSYCLFTSNRLNINVMADFRCRRYMQYFDTSDHGKSIEGMKIIPLETTELKQIIKNHLTYRQLYPLFEQAYRSEKKLPQWYEEEIIDRLLQA